MSGAGWTNLLLSIFLPLLMPIAPFWVLGNLFTLANGGTPWSRLQRFSIAFSMAYFFFLGCWPARDPFGLGYWFLSATAIPCVPIALWWARRPQREPYRVPLIFRWGHWNWRRKRGA